MKDAIERFKHFLTRRYPDRSTTKHYISDLAIFSQFVGDKVPQDITPKLIDDFVQAQSQQGLKAATINRRLSASSSVFEFLISEAEEDGGRNPVYWKRHNIRPGRHLPRDISDDLADRLLNMIDDARDRAMFTLMLSAGAYTTQYPQRRPGSAICSRDPPPPSPGGPSCPGSLPGRTPCFLRTTMDNRIS